MSGVNLLKTYKRAKLFNKALKEKKEYPDMQDYFATEAVKLKLISNYEKAAEYFQLTYDELTN